MGTLGSRQWLLGSIWMWWLLPPRPRHTACAPRGVHTTGPSLQGEFWVFVYLRPHKTVTLLSGAEGPAWPRL